MKTSLRSALVLLTCLSAAVTACGGSSPSTAATAPPTVTQAPASAVTVDACALLSDADIKELTGATVDTKEPGPQAGVFPDGCRWVLTEAGSMIPPEIVLGIRASGGRDYYDRYFKPFNNENDNEPIPNLGDEAVTGIAGTAMVVKGDVLYQVQWLGGSKDLEVEIARKVAENLG
jgi:hypothetical protein